MKQPYLFPRRMRWQAWQRVPAEHQVCEPDLPGPEGKGYSGTVCLDKNGSILRENSTVKESRYEYVERYAAKGV